MLVVSFTVITSLPKSSIVDIRLKNGDGIIRPTTNAAKIRIMATLCCLWSIKNVFIDFLDIKFYFRGADCVGNVDYESCFPQCLHRVSTAGVSFPHEGHFTYSILLY